MNGDPAPPTRPAPPRLLPRALDDGSHESFLKRTFALPFLPALWSAAARWGPSRVVLPLVLLSLSLGAALAVVRTVQLRFEAAKWAQRYDASYPAVVLEGGRARVEGGGVIRFEEGGRTILVDPEESVPLDQIRTPEYVVVRKREIVRKRLFRTERTSLADIQALVGDPFRFDGEAIQAFGRRWGLLVSLGLVALVTGFTLLEQALGAAIYAPLAAAAVWALRGKGLSRGYGDCLRVALAAYSLLVVVEVALTLAGLSPGFCLGVVLWPVSLFGLTLWRVGA